MKKLLCAMLCLCVILVGCGYNKVTVIKLSGDNVKVPLEGIGIIEGEKIEGTISRTVNISYGKDGSLDIDSDVDKIKNSARISSGARCSI